MALRLLDGSEFLHLPKTGGRTVSKLLHDMELVEAEIGHKHADFDQNLFADNRVTGRVLFAEYFQRKIRKWQQGRGTLDSRSLCRRSAFRFCFVRHPLTWYESWWKYMNGHGWKLFGRQNSRFDWHPLSTLNGLGDPDFNTFVRNVVRARPGFVSELYFSFTKPGISFVGKTENLIDDLIAVLHYLDFTFDEHALRSAPKVNVSQAPASAIEWDTELRELMMRLELPALLHFGYLTTAEREELGIPEDLAPHPALQSLPGNSVSEASAA